MTLELPSWLLPILLSALTLGIYDITKKHAVRDNPIMPVLFLATLSGSTLFIVVTILTGQFAKAWDCSQIHGLLILLKSALVAASWTCVYYAMRELPISIAAPIRASSPLWTFIGSLILFSEFPTLFQGFGMLLIFIGYYAFSLLGKMEGLSLRRHKGIHMILLGTLLGAASALYDKYLLNNLKIPRESVQFWFSVDLVFLLGGAWLIRNRISGNSRKFVWRWTIPITGILLIFADYLYFYAVSLPDIHISILSLVRRCSCIVTFTAGVWYFKDLNIKRKAFALVLILAGVTLLALAK